MKYGEGQRVIDEIAKVTDTWEEFAQKFIDEEHWSAAMMEAYDLLEGNPVFTSYIEGRSTHYHTRLEKRIKIYNILKSRFMPNPDEAYFLAPGDARRLDRAYSKVYQLRCRIELLEKLAS